MIIQCENCHKKFKVADEKIPAKGAKVRCPNCKHVFVVKREPEEKKTDEKAFFSFEIEREIQPPEPIKTPEEMEFEAVPKQDQKVTEEPSFEIPRDIQLEEGRKDTLEMERHFIQEDYKKDEEAVERLTQSPETKTTKITEELKEKIPIVKKERRVNPILLTLFILALIVAVFYFIINYTSIQLPIKLFSATEKPISQLKISDLKGFFANNQHSGRLFVISGKVTNNSSAPMSFIRVKGSIFDSSGKKVSENEVFCGNIFTQQELETLERAFIEQRLSNQIGSSLSNMNIPPGKSIDFNIIFFQPPERISEYAVNVVDAQAGVR